MKTERTAPSRWQKFMSGLAMFAMASMTVLSFSGCGGSDDDSPPPPPPPPAPVVAPAAPTAFTATAGVELVNLQWSPPAVSATAGQPASYEIYRSTTATTIAADLVDSTNFIVSIPVDPALTTYSYTDLGLPGATTYYYVVTAKNAVGETPSTVVSARVPGLAPGAPTNFTATAGENLVDLSWSPPAISDTVGLPDSYVIYVSTTATTAETVFAPENRLATVPVVDGRTVYTFPNSALEGTTTYYYVVTAKNADGETPSVLASARPTGSPNPKVAGNNFSAALIFADDIGISNVQITGTWTLDPTAIDFNTGLRPLLGEMFPVGQLLPYLTVPSTVDPLYFEQKTVNTWQGEWAKGKATPQEVNAKWGDNLAGTASLSSTSKIRLEMVLTKDVSATPMTTYAMKSLYGAKLNEMFGTNGVVIPTTTAFVFATNARLTIHKLDADGNKILPAVDDQALFSSVPDGLNKLSAEIPVSGNFTYGYVWDPSTKGATTGTYRITFLLDETSQFGVGNPANNTLMKTATNGVLVSDTEAYIDINVK